MRSATRGSCPRSFRLLDLKRPVMILQNGGMDVFYIDESHDSILYAVTAVAVPFLRKTADTWHIVWPDYLRSAQTWRRRIASDLHIPLSKELHGTKLVSGRGNFYYGSRQFSRPAAVEAYHSILKWIDFIPGESIITVVGKRGPPMFGHERLQRSMYALFQRMRRQCVARSVNAMTFFDQGHPEYRRLYRRARVSLPTGSKFDPVTVNLPLDMFVKDANEKSSRDCLFTQTADLIAYAALAKIREEEHILAADQRELRVHMLYSSVPENVLNKRATLAPPRDGIVRLL
jgi:uncharacterized protein DUF3800